MAELDWEFDVTNATCPVCHGPVPQSGNGRPRKFCSTRCNKKASRDSSTKVCAETGCACFVRARALCAVHYNAQYGKKWKRGNPETRRANLRRKTQLRRALLRDPAAESIDRDQIAERDGWRCGLCAKTIDPTLPWPHPQSASLDHIEPLSLGGKHSPTNVQIAHLACNQAKGNRVTDVQPLLIG